MMQGPRFSANTGFLWKELPFPDRLRAAAAAGFDAVEFHDEAQSSDFVQIRDILAETGLPVCGLNARMGDTAGCSAIAGQEIQACRDVDAAVRTAQALGAGAVHVLAGRTGAQGDRSAYIRVLRHALDNSDIVILIEPICSAAMDDYFLYDIGMAAEIVQEIAHPRLKIMFDCFHVAMESGQVGQIFQRHAEHIGHVQIASVPGRNEPGTDDWLDAPLLVHQMQVAGYAGAFGCEYRPRTSVEAGLGWREAFKEARFG